MEQREHDLHQAPPTSAAARTVRVHVGVDPGDRRLTLLAPDAVMRLVGVAGSPPGSWLSGMPVEYLVQVVDEVARGYGQSGVRAILVQDNLRLDSPLQPSDFLEFLLTDFAELRDHGRLVITRTEGSLISEIDPELISSIDEELRSDAYLNELIDSTSVGVPVELALTAIEEQRGVIEVAQRRQAAAAAIARHHGASWQRIGSAAGLSDNGARNRWGSDASEE